MYQELYRNINGEDYGDIFGYVADNFDQLEYYCEVQDFYNKEDIDLDRYKGSKFGIIVSLHIDEGYRGNGYGTELMEGIISDMEYLKVDYIFIVADGIEPNKFNTVEWYKNKFGFNPLIEKFNCTLMVKTYK